MRISDWSSDVCSSDLLDVLIVDIPDRHTIMANLGDVAFIEKLETTRDRQQRLHVGGDKVFTVVAEPDHQRTGDARDADAVGTLRVEHDDRVGALEPAHRALHRRGQVTAVTDQIVRSEEHTSELQSLMRISYAVFC